MVVVFDEQGPIEIDVLGAQPTGETIIEGHGFDNTAPPYPEECNPEAAKARTEANKLTREERQKLWGEGLRVIAEGGRKGPPYITGGIGNAVEVVETPDHAVRKHSPYGPSKLAYLNACPGFTSTDGTSEAAEQGTRLHEIMDLLVERYKKTQRPLLELLDEYSKESPLDDIERGLLVFCIRELNKWLPHAKEIHNEIRVTILNPDGTELTHGHLDLLLIFERGSALLTDFKFGFVPVAAAPTNVQGKAYALGCYEKFGLKINKLGVKFIQPKLGVVSDAVFSRADLNGMYQEIREIIDRAKTVERDSAGTLHLLNPSDYCSYCQHSKQGTCPAKLKQLQAVALAKSDLPCPTVSFRDLSSIDSPEKAALARYWVELIEQDGFLDGIKSKAKEFAINNGGAIETILPDGQVIRYAVEEKRHDRSLGSAIEVANALNGFLTMEEVLGCADLSITKLENVGKRAIAEQSNADADAAIEGIKALNLPPKDEKKRIKEIRDQFPKKTLKEATEDFQNMLTAQGLLSRPDGTIQVLKRKKNETKQLTK